MNTAKPCLADQQNPTTMRHFLCLSQNKATFINNRQTYRYPPNPAPVNHDLFGFTKDVRTRKGGKGEGEAPHPIEALTVRNICNDIVKNIISFLFCSPRFSLISTIQAVTHCEEAAPAAPGQIPNQARRSLPACS